MYARAANENILTQQIAILMENIVAKSPTDTKNLADEAFMREVDDAVRDSDLRTFWDKWGKWIALALVLGFGSLAGWAYYQNQTAAAVGKQGEAFIKAVDTLEAGNNDEALAQLKPLEDANQAGYRAISKIIRGNVAVEKGDMKTAVAAYEEVITDDSLPQQFRDFALIKKTMAQYDNMKPQEVIDRLKPLAIAGNPWFGSAGEMTAIAYMNLGKEELAGPIFAQIAGQEDLPDSLRNRARQMAGVLGVDAIQLDESEDGAKAE